LQDVMTYNTTAAGVLAMVELLHFCCPKSFEDESRDKSQVCVRLGSRRLKSPSLVCVCDCADRRVCVCVRERGCRQEQQEHIRMPVILEVPTFLIGLSSCENSCTGVCVYMCVCVWVCVYMCVYICGCMCVWVCVCIWVR